MENEAVNVQIRRAGTDDASAIADVLLRSFVEFRSEYTEEGFSATTPDAEQVQMRLDEGPVWLAVRDRGIVGTVSVVPRSDGLYVRGMAVVPEARGMKVGELLLDTVESFAIGEGYRRLLLSTTPFLARAISLYEHCGFIRCGSGDLHGTPLFSMEKTITP